MNSWLYQSLTFDYLFLLKAGRRSGLAIHLCGSLAIHHSAGVSFRLESNFSWTHFLGLTQGKLLNDHLLTHSNLTDYATVSLIYLYVAIVYHQLIYHNNDLTHSQLWAFFHLRFQRPTMVFLYPLLQRKKKQDFENYYFIAALTDLKKEEAVNTTLTYVSANKQTQSNMIIYLESSIHFPFSFVVVS